MLKIAGRGLAGLGRATGIFEKEAHLARAATHLGRAEQRVAQAVKAEQKIFNEALDIQKRINKNSITLPGKATKVRYRYDLRGATHRGIRTPHVQRELLNINPEGVTFWNKDSKWVRPMNLSDLKEVNEYLAKLLNV